MCFFGTMIQVGILVLCSTPIYSNVILIYCQIFSIRANNKIDKIILNKSTYIELAYYYITYLPIHVCIGLKYNILGEMVILAP